MARRETINVSTHPSIAARFRELAVNYDNRLGMCLTAAMLMFLESDPRDQGDFLRRVFDAQIRNEVEDLLEQIRSGQIAKVKERDRQTHKPGK